MIYKDLISSIGNTPLVKVPFSSPASIYAKLEYFNPGGSLKDRSALYMIEHAEKTGQLKPGGTIIEASSGNQGISISMIGAAKGYDVIITVNEKISPEKTATMKSYGAKIAMCPVTKFTEDYDNYHTTALRIQAETPNSFMPNQFFSPINAEGHYHMLGKEIWEQTEGKVTHLFAAAGTGGTISGAGKYLKEKNPAVKVIGLDSENSFYSTNGNPKPYELQGFGIDFDNSPVLNHDFIDEIMGVGDEESFEMLRWLSKHSFLVGPSSGAIALGVKKYLNNLTSDDFVVMVFGDSGRAYLTKGYYESKEDKKKQNNIIELRNTDASPRYTIQTENRV